MPPGRGIAVPLLYSAGGCVAYRCQTPTRTPPAPAAACSGRVSSLRSVQASAELQSKKDRHDGRRPRLDNASTDSRVAAAGCARRRINKTGQACCRGVAAGRLKRRRSVWINAINSVSEAGRRSVKGPLIQSDRPRALA